MLSDWMRAFSSSAAAAALLCGSLACADKRTQTAGLTTEPVVQLTRFCPKKYVQSNLDNWNDRFAKRRSGYGDVLVLQGDLDGQSHSEAKEIEPIIEMLRL